MPDEYEVKSELESSYEQYSKDFRTICADLKDNVKLFNIMTIDEDIERVSKPSPDAKDYSCRAHSARGNSGDNEAERTNSAVGDSIVDGTTLQWEKYPKCHNLTDEQISQLTVEEYDAHEQDRMEMNAWWVAKELSFRIDGEPVFNEYIHSFVTNKTNDAIFFNRECINQFNKTFGDAQIETPETWWQGPVMERIPEPYPDKDNKGHYKDVLETPNNTSTEKRQEKNLLKKKKGFSDYRWDELVNSGKLSTFTRPELKHYLTHYKLSCQGKKNDWIQRICSHLALASAKSTSYIICTANVDPTSDTDDGTDDEYSSSEDEVLTSGMETDDDDVFYIPETTTRSGRSATRVSTVHLH
ncbi:hypothetical protein AC249_AIPGENE6513 [Exaiptasia diaphana]|nr:hypothetical protein AC249_AIPGENE6513 [Exaiptasia diaphana]